MTSKNSLYNKIIDICEGKGSPELLRGNYVDPFDFLYLIKPFAQVDMDIKKIERIESLIKIILQDIFSNPVSGETGRKIAVFFQQLGFLFKYKSYTVKCATPVGYSVFLHNKSEGFSFQRHIKHKTELFHILEVKEGGFVFVCSYKDWQRIYDEKSFAAWLIGEPNYTYDKYKYTPKPGDVIVIDQLGTVHSVIGCVLEEYATSSTDMVDRLYDQNANKQIPKHFSKSYAVQQLKELAIPISARRVIIDNKKKNYIPKELHPLKIRGGFQTTLLKSFLTASLFNIESNLQTDFFQYKNQTSHIYVSSGSGYLLIGNTSEIKSTTPPAIPISSGETVLIAPGLNYAFSNNGSELLKISEQRIKPEKFLVQ